MNDKIEMKRGFFYSLTGKKYFPNWEKSFSQLGSYFKGTYVLRIFLFVMMMVTWVNVWGQTEISSLSEIDATDGNYVITADIDASGFSTISSFTGKLTAQAKADGTFPIISHLRCPLFGTATNATISNIMIKDVAIRQDGPVGAIACTANGATSIYNCGILPSSNTYSINNSAASRNSSIASNNNYCGGLVGLLDGTNDTDKPRVINCFSYANITGGSVRAGIVGYNNYASKYNDLRTMVMNCMFYGDIATGGTISPIYGGQNISNDYNNNTNNRLNNYNYFLYEAPFSKNNIGNSIFSTYNSALAAEERFLVRFEFYRHLLNSTRELAALYATGDPANGKGIGSANQMAKWVLDKSIAPYPILKVQDKYPSVVNYDPNNTYDVDGRKISRSSITERNRGGVITKNNLPQTLTITISGVGTNAPDNASIKTNIPDDILKPNRIDKDTLNFNFNYDKIQLPYYNDVGTGNYTTQTEGNNKISRVVTGWKITSMTNGTEGGYTEDNYDSPNYNYADRDHYGKDIYTSGTGNSGRVYAQGSYFNVPKGVTGITIEPYWGRAAYLSDKYYDRYGYNNTDDLNLDNCGPRHTLEDGKYYITIDDCKQQVFTTASDALGALTGVSNPTVYDYAVVLVGNFHKGDGAELVNNNSKPLTIMSIDLNKDNEPDYCFIFKSSKNQSVSHIRYDFITVPAMAMAHKMASSTDLAIPGNCCPQGWFEITTTGLIKFGQFEHSHQSKTLSPLILMGGVIDQFVANNTNEGADAPARTKYMLFGDNVWFKMFNNGCHMDKFIAPPRRPISITGGDYETFYLSGFYRPDAKPSEENAECYIDGGRFGEVAGAGQEQIDGNVTWLINHADIKNFYGGGINAAKPITGNIETTIKNSYVDFFCGGPQFGNMQTEGNITIKWATNKAGTSTSSRTKNIKSNRVVNTTAENCTFGTYFGAGYGGTSTFREQFYNQFEKLNYNEWNTKVNGTYTASTRGKYTEGKGVAYDYEYEFFGGSRGNVHRLYLLYASFSMAKANDVISKLTDCTVQNNFYGGGSLGAVLGEIKSTLTDCTIKGNVFGAGYSVTKPIVKVRKTGGFTTEPYYNTSTGVYEEGVKPGFDEYVWDQQSIGNGGNALGLDDENHDIIKTSEDLSGLGSVSSAVTLTITTTTNGKSIIGTEGDNNTGNVYGGGDASAVNNAITPANASTTVNISGNTLVRGNVFGGGNEGIVSGSTTVNIRASEPTP